MLIRVLSNPSSPPPAPSPATPPPPSCPSPKPYTHRAPLPSQLTILARTNIMMAVHGAGVFNLIWLPRHTGTVLELMHNSGESSSSSLAPLARFVSYHTVPSGR